MTRTMATIQYGCGQPGKKSVEFIRRDKAVTSPSYTRDYAFVYKRAKDVWLWDVDSNKYLDCAAGIAVMSVGHTNPAVVKAIKDQAGRGLHAGFPDFYAELPVRFCEELISHMPSPSLHKVFLSNSGTESVECAYKLARWHSRKKWFIAFTNAFHGRTMGSLSMTNSKPVQRERFGPFLPVKHTPYPYRYRWPSHRGGEASPQQCSDEALALLEKTMKSLKEDIAGLMVEPVQGEGGYIVPPKQFFKGVRSLCNEHDVLLCDDEVQAGVYRTGPFLAMENHSVIPDIVSMSKAIGGGVPLGATISTSKIMDWSPGSHSNTFGGNLLACAGGIATLRYLKEHKLGENARTVGSYLLRRLNELKEEHDTIGDVRGLGLMIGVEFVKDKTSKAMLPHDDIAAILCEAKKNGLLLLACGKNCIRFSPPLTMTKQHVDLAVGMFDKSVSAHERMMK